jgi:hypothetical protein
MASFWAIAELGRSLDNAHLQAGPREQHGGRCSRAAAAHHDNVVHVFALLRDEIALTAFTSEIDD